MATPPGSRFGGDQGSPSGRLSVGDEVDQRLMQPQRIGPDGEARRNFELDVRSVSGVAHGGAKIDHRGFDPPGPGVVEEIADQRLHARDLRPHLVADAGSHSGRRHGDDVEGIAQIMGHRGREGAQFGQTGAFGRLAQALPVGEQFVAEHAISQKRQIGGRQQTEARERRPRRAMGKASPATDPSPRREAASTVESWRRSRSARRPPGGEQQPVASPGQRDGDSGRDETGAFVAEQRSGVRPGEAAPGAQDQRGGGRGGRRARRPTE